MEEIEAEKDDKLEQEWTRALARGSQYVIHDIKQHFKLKNLIKSRMLEVAQILNQCDTV